MVHTFSTLYIPQNRPTIQKYIEMCAKRKLKSFLEEPAARLPQYLQHLADVYVAFEHESGINCLFVLYII